MKISPVYGYRKSTLDYFIPVTTVAATVIRLKYFSNAFVKWGISTFKLYHSPPFFIITRQSGKNLLTREWFTYLKLRELMNNIRLVSLNIFFLFCFVFCFLVCFLIKWKEFPYHSGEEWNKLACKRFFIRMVFFKSASVCL